MSFSELLEHYQMNHVEWGVFWNSITVQAISRRCSGIGLTPFHWEPLVMVFLQRIWIYHTLRQLIAQSWSIYKWDMLFQLLILKHAVAWIFFPCWRSDFCMEMIICIAILVFLGIWKISPTCTVKDLVSKRSQWIMSSPRLLKHVLWTWFDNIAVLY